MNRFLVTMLDTVLCLVLVSIAQVRFKELETPTPDFVFVRTLSNEGEGRDPKGCGDNTQVTLGIAYEMNGRHYSDQSIAPGVNVYKSGCGNLTIAFLKPPPRLTVYVKYFHPKIQSCLVNNTCRNVEFQATCTSAKQPVANPIRLDLKNRFGGSCVLG